MSDTPIDDNLEAHEEKRLEGSRRHVANHDLEKHRLTCGVELARIQSLKDVQRYCLLGTWLASIASMLVVLLLFGMAIFLDQTSIIHGWHIVSIAGILFICVAIYGAYIFRSSISAAIEEGRFDLSVKSQPDEGSAGTRLRAHGSNVS